MVRRPVVFFGAGFTAALRLAAHLFFIIADMRFRAAGLIVRRPVVSFDAGFAAALRLAAHRAFIIADRRLRPAGVSPRFLACAGAALAAGVVAVAVPSSDSRTAMAWLRRFNSAFRSVRKGLVSIFLLPLIVTNATRSVQSPCCYTHCK